MQERFKLKRDYYAGGLMLVLGVGAAVIGTGYKFGTLARMGPGFMPVMLGIVLAFLGILIAGTALASSEPDDNKFLPDNPQWFGWLCILGGPILFIILGQYGGMIPAVFACVFVCALGDKTGDLQIVAHPGGRRHRVRRAAVPLSAEHSVPAAARG